MSEEPQEPQTGTRPLPWVAVGITIVLCGIAVHQQVTRGKVDNTLLGLLVVLVLFWSGRGADKLLERFFG